MGAQVDRGQASKQMQLAAAGRARRADAIGRRGDDSENVEEGGEVFMGGNPNFDESTGQGEFGPGILSGGINQAQGNLGQMTGINFGPGRANRGGPMDMISEGGRGSYAQFLQKLVNKQGSGK